MLEARLDSTTKQLLTRLKQLRKRHDLTQEAFAELSGISYKYYQLIETGRRPKLQLPTLIRLAKAYGLEIYQLFLPELPKTTVKNIPSKKKRRGKKKDS